MNFRRKKPVEEETKKLEVLKQEIMVAQQRLAMSTNADIFTQWCIRGITIDQQIWERAIVLDHLRLQKGVLREYIQ